MQCHHFLHLKRDIRQRAVDQQQEKQTESDQRALRCNKGVEDDELPPI